MPCAFYNCSYLESVSQGDTKFEIFNVNGYTNKLGNIDVGEGAFDEAPFPSVVISDGEEGTEAFVEVYNCDDVETLTFDLSLNDNSYINTHEVLILTDENHYTVDFGAYGLFEKVNVSFDNTLVEYTNVGITAEEYNISFLNGTYPVLVYSLKIDEITQDGEIPTFVYLERNAAYNWQKLPENVYTIPTVSKEKSIMGDFHEMRNIYSDYIKTLYDLNPYSKFNFYLVDNYCELLLEFAYANNIPEENWSATLLSDGAGTAFFLSSTFGVDNPSDKYDDMVDNWEDLKEAVADGNYSNTLVHDETIYPADETQYSILSRYAYVIDKAQDNVSWWVNRLRVGENLSAINAKDPTFAADIVATPTSFYTNNLLAALDEEGKQAFKELYHFSDEMFSYAEEQNKKVMVILGTDWNGEKSSFYDYIKLTMDFYGDGYVYYYKGHPGFATSNFPDRQTELNTLAANGYEVLELDCSIAAEVILFYNPDIYLCGWPSSTFDSVESELMACSLFNCTLAGSTSYTYADMIDIFISNLTSSEYNGITLNSEHDYYLIEYNNCDDYSHQVENYNKHEFAIYDSTINSMKYYKMEDSVAVEVTASGEAIS